MSWLIAHAQFVVPPLVAAAYLGLRAWHDSGFKLPAIGGSKRVDSPHEALDHLAAVQQYLFNNGRGDGRQAALAKCTELAHAIIDSGFIGGPVREDAE